MRKQTLGRTGLVVTELGYGTGQLRGDRIWNGRSIQPEQAGRMLNRVLDSGINFIDTANVYGRAEDYIGQFISQRRSEYYLATKCGCQLVNMGDHDETPRNWTRAHLEESIHNSLKRMKTDYVDLLQFHNPTFDDLEKYDLVRVMEDARRAGKTRFVGISTTVPDLPHILALGVFDVFQIPYSALEREHEAWLQTVADAHIGTIIRGGVAKGALAKSGSDLWEHARLDDLLDGMSRMDFMLRFTLSHPAAHTTIVATINPDHLQDNLAAAEKGPLPIDTYEEAKRRLSQAEQELT